MTRRVAICGGDGEQWRCKSECEDDTRMVLHVSRGDNAVVLQPAKDMRKTGVDKSLPYLPGDGPSLPMDVHTNRVVNIARVSYRNAELCTHVLGSVQGDPNFSRIGVQQPIRMCRDNNCTA